MRVALLWWRECPSWGRAIELVRKEMAGVGLDPDDLDVIEVRDEDDAKRHGFVGSPTVRVNGHDIVPTGAEPPGLTCRVYRRPDGRVSPLPDSDEVRDALGRAAREEEQ